MVDFVTWLKMIEYYELPQYDSGKEEWRETAMHAADGFWWHASDLINHSPIQYKSYHFIFFSFL